MGDVGEIAPVEIIQSTKPDFKSGIRQERPSPAGVRAPLSVSPTVTSGSSIRSTKSRQLSRRRAAL